MNTNRRKKILMAGLSLSAICLIVSLIMLMQPPSGNHSRPGNDRHRDCGITDRNVLLYSTQTKMTMIPKTVRHHEN